MSKRVELLRRLELPLCEKDQHLTIQLPTEAQKRRWPNIVLLALVVLVEVAWGLTLLYLVLRFL